VIEGRGTVAQPAAKRRDEGSVVQPTPVTNAASKVGKRTNAASGVIDTAGRRRR